MAIQLTASAMIISVLIGLSVLTAAQSDPFIMNPTDCLGTTVTLSSCTSMLNKAQTCFGIDDPDAQASCYCPQSVLNYIAGCHQQMWDCFPNTFIDGLFEGTTGFYYSWSTVCQEVFTYSPTTMIVTKPPAYDQEFCNNVALDCDSLTVSMTSCNSAYSTAAADLNNCLCNDDMLYYGSRCDVDANERCLRRTLDPSSLYSNKICGGTAQTGPTSRLSLDSSSTTSRLEPTSSYVPPAPSSVVSPRPAATSGSTSDGAARQAMGKRSSIIVFALVVAVSVT